MLDASAITGSREEKLAHLRKRLAAMPGRHTPAKSIRPSGAAVGALASPPGPPSESPSGSAALRDSALQDLRGPDSGAPGSAPGAERPWGMTSAGTLPVHPELARLLPGGGLPCGTVGTVEGAASLAVSLVATVTAAGARVALCGWPGFGFAAALEQGADPERIAVIEGPLPDPVAVASILLDGADVVLCGLGGIAVPPTRSRALAARARSTGAVLLVSGGRWEGATLHLGARVRGYRGIGGPPGQGRVRGIDLLFSARGKGCVPRDTGTAGLAVAR